ncbi:hypothetical protein ACET3Z_015413 [Daucus carota]
MAASGTMISALTPQKDSDTINVRVTRVWEAINKRNGQVMFTNLILLDEQDNHILATVRNNQKDIYLPLLSEQGVYNISNLKVVPGPPSYRSVDNDLAINFYYKTKIQAAADTGVIPHHKFELKQFKDIPNYVANVANFIEPIVFTIAHLNMIRNLKFISTCKTNNNRLFISSKTRNERVIVALWESRATNFLDLLPKEGKDPVFVVITGLLAKKYSENVLLSSSDATKTYFNIDYPPLQSMRQAISEENANRGKEMPAPVTLRFVQSENTSAGESNIRDILEAKLPAATTFLRRTCEATIVAVMEGEGWYYNCCPRCARKVQNTEGKYYCTFCSKEAEDFRPRFKLTVRVEDSTAQTTFTLFNKEAEQIVGIPVDKIIDELPEGTNIGEIPPVIRNIIGKRCVFDVKINEYNTVRGYEDYTVFRLKLSDQMERASTSNKDNTDSSKKQRVN